MTFDTVVHAKRKEEILEEAKRLSGGSNESKKWLPHYQTAKKIIKEQLSEEERKEFEDEVQKWKTAGVPSEVRAE